MPPQGYNAQLANVELVITAFKDGLKQQGYKSRQATDDINNHVYTTLSIHFSKKLICM